MKKCNRLAVCVALSAALAMGVKSAEAQTNAVISGNWSTGSTWSAGEPTFTSTATIDGSRTVTIDQSGELASVLDVGTIAGQTGNINITGGTLDLGDFDPGTAPDSVIRLGQAAGSTGNLTMSGGTVFIAEDIVDAADSGDLIVGNNGTGTLTMTGGLIDAGDELLIALNPGSSGALTISGGEIKVSRRNLIVGFAGSTESLPGGHGELNVSGTAQINLANWMFTSFDLGSTSVVNQSGGAIDLPGLLVHATRGDSTYNHTGGSVSAFLGIIGDNFAGPAAANAGAHGIYNISGSATLDTDVVIWVGNAPGAVGTLNQNGGTINAGALMVGRDGTGEVNLASGSMTLKGTDGFTPANHLIVGMNENGSADENLSQGTGVFHQTGGTITVKTGVFLGNFDNSDGTYKISGGTLNVDGTGTHGNPANFEDFKGDFSVGGALASNAVTTRVEPAGPGDAQGQALNANGTFIVSGSAATIDIAGNFLANPADKSAFRKGPDRDNSATLGFEIFNSSGTSLIDVAGVADLDGAVIDLDLMGGYNPAINTTFDLLRADTFGATGSGTTQNVGTGKAFSLASEDTGGWNLAVVTSGSFEILRATFLGSVGTPGDFDNDGDVDGRDFLRWQRGGSPNPLSAGDLALWQNNYGAGGLAAVSAVPEPSTVVLFGVVGLFISACRARGQRA